MPEYINLLYAPGFFSLEIKSIVKLKIKTVGGKILKKSTLESYLLADFLQVIIKIIRNAVLKGDSLAPSLT